MLKSIIDFLKLDEELEDGEEYIDEKSELAIIFSKEQKKEYVYYEKSNPVIQPIGTILIEFLNTNFEEGKQFATFVRKYGLNSFVDMLPFEEFKGASAEEMHKALVKIFNKIQHNFIYTVDFTYNIYSIENIAELSPFERYYTSRISNNAYKIEKYRENIDIRFDLDPNYSTESRIDTVKEKDIIQIIKKYDDVNLVPFSHGYFCKDISRVCYISLLEIINTKELVIKKCQYCGKYFIPQNRNDELYCNNIYKDGKTCKEIGSQGVFKQKLEQDDALKLYRTVYHKKFNRTRRNPENEGYKKDFDWWRENAKRWKEDVSNAKKTNDEFKEWLMKTK